MKINYLNLFKENVIDHEKINDELIQNIANTLLSKYVIVDGTKEYRICEIEFYINNSYHNDKYTHNDPNQKTFGKWYFHKYKTGSYKSGTYKGMDLTLGSDNTFFGILIRSIYDIETDTLIEGPCKTVNKFLENNGFTEVKNYLENKKTPISVRCTKNIYLKRKTSLQKEIIYRGPRIGLSDKYPEWQQINYRFLIKKKLIKKGKSQLIETLL